MSLYLYTLSAVLAGFAGAALWSGAVRAWRWGSWRLDLRVPLGRNPCIDCGARWRNCDCVPF